MRSIFLSFIVFLCLAKPQVVFADKICGRILAPNGLNVRTTPDLTSPKIHKLAYGTSFAYFADGPTGIHQSIMDGSVEIKGEWVKIILYPKFNKEYEAEAFGYIFYCPQYVEDIPCEEFQHQLYERDLYENAFDDQAAQLDSLRAFLQLSFVDQQLFDQYKALANQQVQINAKDYKVDKDTLVLALAQGKKKRIINYPWGKNGDEDFRESYVYLGFVPALNQYLIQGSYWETGDYQFIDRSTGQKTQTFYGFPHVSPQENYILSLESDANYYNESDLQIFKIKNGKIKLIFAYSFGKWIYKNELVWISDQEAIIKVGASMANHPIQVYHEEEKNTVSAEKDRTIQFIKIKIL